MLQRTLRVALGAALLLGSGCPSPAPADVGLVLADAGPDAVIVEPDASPAFDAPEAPPDAGSDGGVDAPLDVGVDAPPDANLDANPLARGAELYTRHCALCHGARGEGYAADNAPAIAFPDYLRIATNAFLETAIYDGRPGTPMSAWGSEHGGPFTRADSLAVVDYLRSFAVGAPEDVSGIVVTGDATRGAPLYAARCASCHGARGQGVSAPTLDNVVLHDSASDGFLRRSIEVGRPGTPMEGYGGRLAAQELDDVVAFLRTLRRIPPPLWPIEDLPSASELVLNPAGAAPTFTLRDGRYVPAAEVNAAMMAGRRIILLDARATSDWVLGHIPGAGPFPFYSVDDLASMLPTDGTWIIAYCACPHAASGRVVDQLRARGFANTAVLDEGIVVWQDRGYPMARGRLP